MTTFLFEITMQRASCHRHRIAVHQLSTMMMIREETFVGQNSNPRHVTLSSLSDSKSYSRLE